MSDPTMVYVGVEYPDRNVRKAVKDFAIEETIQGALAEGTIETISHGYENPESWGEGQGKEWQKYEAGWSSPDSSRSGITIPNFVGVPVGGTWHGVVLFNRDMRRAIKNAKSIMKGLFPHKEVMVIIAGQQV